MFRYVLVETAVITRTKKSDTHAHLIKVNCFEIVREDFGRTLFVRNFGAQKKE